MKILLTVIITLISTWAISQSMRFNKTYSDEYPGIRNIAIVDSGYFLVGGGGSSSYYILTAYIDSLGNLKWLKKISKPNYNIYHGLENSLTKTNTGYIIGGTLESISSNLKEPIIIFYDNNFDTISMHKYLPDTNYTNAQCVTQASNKKIYLVGVKYINSNYDVLLIKTDSLGDMISSETYGGLKTDYGTKIINTIDKGLLIGGFTRSFSSLAPGYAGEWYFIKTDSNGVMQWQNNYGNPDFDDFWVRGLINTHDSGYVATGGIAVADLTFRGYIIKFDKNLDTLWSKKLLFQSDNSLLLTTIETSDNSLVTVGPEEYNYSVLLKLDAQGNQVWKRNLTATNNPNSQNTLLTVKQTTDGGFIAAGFCNDSQLNPSQQMWVIKTNCLGYIDIPVAGFSHSGSISQHSYIYYNQSQNADSCIWDFGDGSPPFYAAGTDTVEHVYSQTGFYTVQLIAYTGCPVQDRDTLQQLILVSIVGYDNIFSETGLVTIRPNPAKEKVCITVEHEIKNMQLYIFNQQGAMVCQTLMSGKSIEINTQNWLPGVYVVKLISEKGFVVKKLVIE